MESEGGTPVDRASVPPGRWSAPTALVRALSDSSLLQMTGLGVTLIEMGPEPRLLYCNEAFRRSPWAGRELGDGDPLGGPVEERDRRGVRSAHQEVARTGLPARVLLPSGAGEVELLPLSWGSRTVTHVLGLWGGSGRREQLPVLRALRLVTEHLADADAEALPLGRLSRSLAGLVGASRVAFWRHDPARRVLALAQEPFGFSPGEPPPLIAGSLAGDELMALGEAVIWSRADPNVDLAWAPEVLEETLGVRDAIVAPWRVGHRRLGVVIACDSRGATGFTQEDAWALQAAATAAALVVGRRRDDARTAARDPETAGLRRQIDRSVQLEQMKTNLLRLVSHELRAPLAVLRGYLSMVEEGTLPLSELPSVLPLLRARVEEMGHLIDEIMEAARLEDSAVALTVHQVDLREVVVAAVHSLEPLAGSDHPLRLRLSGRRALVKGDRARLALILTALIHNAIKYSPGGGEVQVECRVGPRTASVAVSDHGVGIARRDRPRLFTRFGRIVTPETEHIPGTGLGLYLARDLARRHGGDIHVRSWPGRGSTFTLRLPLWAPTKEGGAAA
ncbi:MAG TPA: ATP-binding protein [Candidatus Dormibacteraeota bacterium]|nr:ATP-binding protein [Candidatus Dormibacteraeota bacterium]